MTYKIKYIGGPRAGKIEDRGFLTPPRAIVRNAEELAAGGAPGYYKPVEIDHDTKTAAYKWQPSRTAC